MKTLLRRSGIFAIALLMVNLFFASAAFGQATLTSDQPDYMPGTTATLTGTGFQSGEIVRVQVVHADYEPGEPVGTDHEPWDVTADSDGNFTTTWHVCEDDCVGATLIATADGQTSLLHAEVFFTDAAFTSRVTGNWNNVDTWVAIARTGTITANTGSPTVTGVGTSFLTEIAIGDKIFASNGTTLIGTVLSIGSNTSLTLTANASNNITAAAFTARKVPGAADAVTIASGHTVTVTAAAAASSITFPNTATSNATLTVNIGITLAVTNGITLQNDNDDNTFATLAGAGTITCASVTVGGNTTNLGSDGTTTLTSTISTLTISGNLSINGEDDPGDGENNASFLIGAGTVTVQGIVVLDSDTDDNDAVATLSLDNTSPETGTLILSNAAPFTLTGNGTETTDFNGSGATVNYSGAAQTALPTTYTNLTLSTSDIKTFATTPTVEGILSMEGTATVTVTTGVVTYGAGATLQYNTATARIASSEEWITPFLATGGVIIDNTGTITLNAAKQFGNNSNVPLNIKPGATLSTSGSNFGLTFHDSFINDGTLSAGSSAITIAGTLAAPSIDGFTTTGTISFTKTAGTATLAGAVNGGAVILNGNGGTLNTGGNNITGTGTLTLTNNAIITLGGTPHILSFANSSGAAWSGAATLTINGWAGGYDGTAGTAGRIFVGTTSGGLTAGQLAQIQFFNGSINFPATLLSDGEVVPFSPPPSNLSYTTPNTFVAGVAITNLNPTVTGIVTSYSVSPALPAGLILNTITGVISGTPTTPTATNTYTVTATNINIPASTTFDVEITVNANINRYAVVTGLWDGPIWAYTATGVAGSAPTPTSADDANINSGVTVTVNVAANCLTLTFPTNNASPAVVNINAGITLSVSGAITIPRSNTGVGPNTVGVDGGFLNAGSIAFTNAGGTNRHQVTISTGTVTVTGNIVGSSGDDSPTILFSGAGLLRIGGSLFSNSDGTLTTFAGSTVEYNGGGQTVQDFTYSNLTLSGTGTKTIGNQNIVANGATTVLAGITLNLDNDDLSTGSLILECGAAAGSSITGISGSVITLGGNVTVNDAAGAGTSGASISSAISLGATRTFTVADDGSTAADLSISGVISGGGSGLIKVGPGTLVFSDGTNTYTGATTITAGELRLNPTGNVTPNSQTVLNGGTLSTTGIAATRIINNASTLNLNANSSITLGSNSHELRFANSNAIAWAGTSLVINGWTGTAGSPGTAGKIFIDASSTALTGAQLAKISFTGFAGAAMLLSTGELVPQPNEPLLVITGITNHGSFCVGTAGSAITYTITNFGFTAATDVTVNSNNDPEFAVSNLSSTTIAGSGGTATYQVTFTPGAIGARNATITVASTTPGSNSPTSALTGTGVAGNDIGFNGDISDNEEPICQGFTATIVGGADPSGGETFIWEYSTTGPAGSFSPVTPNPGDVQNWTISSDYYNFPNTYYFRRRITGSSSCNGNSDVVTFTVNALPIVAGTQTVCVGSTTTFSSTMGGGVWDTEKPLVATVADGEVSGISAGTANISYTVTATGCKGEKSVTVIAPPTSVTASPLTSTICSGSNVNLAGSANVSPTLLSESFNGTPAFTVTGTTTGGIIWTKENSGFNVPLVATWNSPDASPFMLTYAASFGTATTNTTLVSTPVINSTGYSSLSLSFKHTYKQGDVGSPFGIVEVSTDPGNTTWTTVQTYTSNQGSGSAFATVTGIDLDAYVNQPNLKIRFNFSSSVSFASSWWAIDDVLINGTPSPLFSWTANTGAGENGLPAGAETPSVSNANITVNPAATTTYTLTAQASGCSVNSAGAVVTVKQPPTISNADDQTICAGQVVVLEIGVSGDDAQPITWTSSSENQPGYIGFTDAHALSTTYTPSEFDITNGSVTLTVTTSNPVPCGEDSKDLVITINTATAKAGPDEEICAGATIILGGERSGDGVTGSTWETSGDGTFDDDTELGATYTPGENDKELGTVTLTLTTNEPDGPCGAASDFMILTIKQLPAVPVIAAPTPAVLCPNSLNNYYYISNSGVYTSPSYTWSFTPAGAGVTIDPSDEEAYIDVEDDDFTLSVEVTDEGCSSSGSLPVTVEDITAPTGATTIVGTTGIDACYIDATTPPVGTPVFDAIAAADGYTDNCGGAVTAELTNTEVTGDNCSWTVTYTFKVVDEHGNAFTGQTYSHTGGDDTDPTATAPDGGDIECADDLPEAVTTIAGFNALAGAEASDNCTLTADLQVSHNDVVTTAGSCNGVITRTYTITDDCGNSKSVDQVFTVTDDTDPTVTAPTTTDIECADDLPEAETTIAGFNALTGAEASDNCTLTANLQVSHNDVVTTAGSCNGVITRTYTITDDCGNSKSVDHVFTVTDDTDPTVTAPDGSDIECADDLPEAVTTIAGFNALAGAEASDNCTLTADLQVSHDDVVTTAGSCNGVITRTYTITDDCGNTKSVDQVFTVTDDTDPTATAPDGGDLECADDLPEAVTTIAGFNALAGAEASDNCTLTADLQVSHNDVVTTAGSCNGVITRTYTITDDCGNSKSVDQVFTVTDNTDPSVTAPTGGDLECADDLPEAETTIAGFNALAGAEASDNCTLTANLQVSHNDVVTTAGSCNGIITRTYTITDDCGNSKSVDHVFTVTDNTVPVINNCKLDLNRIFDFGETNYTAVGGEFDVEAEDNCSMGSLTYGLSGATSTPAGPNTSLEGVDFNLGETTVTWTAIDACGNTGTTCVFKVTVGKRPTTLTYTGDFTEQYSDQQLLKAVLKDQTTNVVLVGKTVSFTLGSQSASDGPGAPGNGTDANGVAEANLTITQAPGKYNLSGSFAGDDTYVASSFTYNTVSPDNRFEVKCEDAVAEYSGQEFGSTGCTDCTSTTVLLEATVQDITALTSHALYDAFEGDISKAKIRFVVTASAGAGFTSPWLPVQLVGSDIKLGKAVHSQLINIGANNAVTYDVAIEFGNGSYYCGSVAYGQFTVSKTLTDFIVGGGHVRHPSPANSWGEYKADLGQKTNYGFNVKYNKKGTNLQGNVNIIVRSGGVVYQFKGIVGGTNGTLAVDASDPNNRKASLTAKVKMNYAATGLEVPGTSGLTLQMKMADKGEPGINNDTYSVYVYRPNGTLIYSSNWTGTTTTQVPVSGGNIQVSGVAVGVVSVKEAITGIGVTPDTSAARLLKPVDKLHRGIKVFEVKAWPNPAAGSHFNVRVTSPVKATVEVRMYDMKGRMIQMRRGATDQALRFGDGVPAGIYIIEARQAGSADKETIKVIKVN